MSISININGLSINSNDDDIRWGNDKYSKEVNKGVTDAYLEIEKQVHDNWETAFQKTDGGVPKLKGFKPHVKKFLTTVYAVSPGAYNEIKAKVGEFVGKVKEAFARVCPDIDEDSLDIVAGVCAMQSVLKRWGAPPECLNKASRCEWAGRVAFIADYLDNLGVDIYGENFEFPKEEDDKKECKCSEKRESYWKQTNLK